MRAAILDRIACSEELIVPEVAELSVGPHVGARLANDRPVKRICSKPKQISKHCHSTPPLPERSDGSQLRFVRRSANLPPAHTTS